MMPDLGKYADAVLSSYAVSLVLLALIVWLSLRRSKRIKSDLEEVERKVKSNG
ncbi:Heme exporter protein D (CcmD) [Roseovarius tolerans]|jgi:heme exporter protein D|uniref:Heme exporter protein D n=2 Tax=Roseovarius tolerans TaxID=74031 RepID=A0A0L6CZB9_9RHOB|nr:heme exporter protein CcmD [Roseovarius tolerans]KNX43084.1 Heme exporter protein D (CcmD) [Roseovarius tolerans]SEM81176.1 heme exporter protein D [Roseovarius tolerans]